MPFQTKNLMNLKAEVGNRRGCAVEFVEDRIAQFSANMLETVPVSMRRKRKGVLIDYELQPKVYFGF